jgi:2-polyprenyl-3-methyl-5-hydroxy-6-metoxy-1,4-benzoquinol methylase
MTTYAHNQVTCNLEKYARTGGVEGRLLARFAAGLVASGVRTRPASLLDAGCGEGVATQWFAEQLPYTHIAGVDARSEAVAEAGRRLPDVELRVGDVYELPYPDGAFELVVCTEVLEHLEHPRAALAELARVSCGHLLVTVPHEPFFRSGNLARGRYVRRAGSTPGHLNTWGRLGFTRLVAREAEVVRWVGLFPWQGVLARPR